MSTDDHTPFQDQLKSIYEQHRHRSLESRLDDIAETMEETLLQQTIAEAFFEESIEIDSDVKRAVEGARETLDSEEYEELEDELANLSTQIERAEAHVTNRIQNLRIDRQDTASAMKRLNERVERVDEAQLDALLSLLEDWNWKQDVYRESNETFVDRREAAEQYGSDMKFIFETLKDELFGPYRGTKVEPLVDKLLDDDRFRLSDLSAEQRKQLVESDLADYIELKLS
jgi:hypothetical protein